MARFDIMPWKSPEGGHIPVTWGPVAGSQAFAAGDALAYSGGQLVAASDNASTPLATLAGIAAIPATYQLLAGTTITLAANDKVPYYRWDRQNTFISKNYSTAGAGSEALAAVTGAARGTLVGLLIDGASPANWWFDSNAGTTKIGGIEDVLDANFNPVVGSTAGTYIVVRPTGAAGEL